MAWTMRCETCVHWEPPDDFDRKHNGARGACLRIVHVDDAASDALAAVTDYEGFKAWLRVHATFGCVLWEAKRT